MRCDTALEYPPRASEMMQLTEQWGGRTPKAGGRELDGRVWDEMPARAGVAA